MGNTKKKRDVLDPLYRGPIHEPVKSKNKRVDYFRPADAKNRQLNADMLVFYNAKPFNAIIKHVKDELMEHTNFVTNLKFTMRYPFHGKVSFTVKKGRRRVKIQSGRKIDPSDGRPNRTLECYDVFLSNKLVAQEFRQEKVIEWINNYLEEIYK